MQQSSISNRYDPSYRNSPVYPSRSYHFQNMQKSTQFSQTDKRIQQIKKKYDTPNRRERLSHLSGKKSDYFNKQNDNYGTAQFKTKPLYSATPNINNISDSCLKQSNVNVPNRASMYQNNIKSSLLINNSNSNNKFDSKYNNNTQYQQYNRLYKNQNEQQFFKRVKQMKQSLLYSDNNVRTNNNINNMNDPTYFNQRIGNNNNNHNSIDSRAKLNGYDSNQTVQRDRIDNIDKINQKIKGILECLNQNQKGRPKYTDINHRRSRIDNVNTLTQNLISNNNNNTNNINNNTNNINTNTNNNKNDVDYIRARDLARTPVKSVFSSSIIGKTTSSFIMNNNNRNQDKSQLLDKIEINKNSNEKTKKYLQNQDDQKWDKLSTKLEKYQMENKLRMQKALQLSKTSQIQTENNNIQLNNRQNNHRQPEIKDYRHQQTKQYRQPQTKQYRQQQTKQYRQPQIKQYRQPQTKQYKQLDTKDYRQPQTKQYKQLDTKDYRKTDYRQFDNNISTKIQQRRPQKQIQRRSYIEPTFTHQRDSSSTSVDLNTLRSRTFITPHLNKQNRDHSLHHVRNPTATQSKFQMRSGKKLDDEITKIQKKIQQFQQQKKRLNINFKPFAYSNSRSTSNLGLKASTGLKYQQSQRKTSQISQSLYKYTPKTNNIDRNIIIKDQIRDFDYKKQQKQQGESTFRDKYRETFGIQQNNKKDKKSQYSFDEHNISTKYNNNQDRLNRHIEIKIQKSNQSSVKTSKFISQNSSQVSQRQNSHQQSYAVEQQTKQEIQIKTSLVRANNNKQEQQNSLIFNQNLKKQTNQGIEQRRKRLQNVGDNQNVKNGQLKRFVNNLCEQVKLDEQFRNAKIWFQYDMSANKQEQIRKFFPNMRVEQLRQILKVRESQNNPFFTAQGFDSSLKNVAQMYKACQRHWQQNILQQFKRNVLQDQSFIQKQIDLQRKGHVSLGDLVRFLNLQSGTFYRNRDIALIFIRICKKYQCQSYTQLDFKYLLETFTY